MMVQVDVLILATAAENGDGDGDGDHFCCLCRCRCVESTWVVFMVCVVMMLIPHIMTIRSVL